MCCRVPSLGCGARLGLCSGRPSAGRRGSVLRRLLSRERRVPWRKLPREGRGTRWWPSPRPAASYVSVLGIFPPSVTSLCYASPHSSLAGRALVLDSASPATLPLPSAAGLVAAASATRCSPEACVVSVGPRRDPPAAFSRPAMPLLEASAPRAPPASGSPCFPPWTAASLLLLCQLHPSSFFFENGPRPLPSAPATPPDALSFCGASAATQKPGPPESTAAAPALSPMWSHSQSQLPSAYRQGHCAHTRLRRKRGLLVRSLLPRRAVPPLPTWPPYLSS